MTAGFSTRCQSFVSPSVSEAGQIAGLEVRRTPALQTGNDGDLAVLSCIQQNAAFVIPAQRLAS
jgi:hypothetical protein